MNTEQKMPIIQRIKTDHFADNYASKELNAKVQEIQQQGRPHWECRIILEELQALMDNPNQLTDEVSKGTHAMIQERIHILHVVSPSNAIGDRAYAQTILDLPTTTDSTKKIPNSLRDKLVAEVDMGLQRKYESIARLLGKNVDDNDLVGHIQANQKELYQLRLEALDTRMRLSQYIDRYVKITLEILDTVWLILKEFKCHLEEEKNRAFDMYYCTLAESLLLRMKMLHTSTLTATYDPQFADALKSLRSILQTRFNDAQTQLSFAQKRIQEYQDLGPDFTTLANAYSAVLCDIQGTEEDIERIRRHQS